MVQNNQNGYGLCRLGARVETGGDEGPRAFSLFMFASDGTASLRQLGKGFPVERREQLISLLRAVTDFDAATLRGCDSFWRLANLRVLAGSEAVRTSKVGALIGGEVGKLSHLDGEAAVLFGVLENAGISQLSDLRCACTSARAGRSHAAFYDNLMAADRLLYLDGYRRRRYTDPGFEYRIRGRRSVCRFCGNAPTQGATFRKAPHAISYFFGNRFLLGAAECDACNEFFGRQLEPHFFRYYQPTMLSVGKTGRGKNPYIEGENFAARLGELQLNMAQGDADIAERLMRGEEVPIALNDSQPYVKADIYRCLCKYVVSVIDDSELPDFADTVDWIMKRRLSGRLPVTYRNEKDFGCADAPVLDIFSPDGPYAADRAWIVSFRFLTNLWVFAVPYVGGIRNDRLNGILQRFVSRHIPRLDFVSEDFSCEGQSYVTTHLTQRLTPESRLVRLTDMPPAEQDAFTAAIPPKWRR